MPLAFVTPVVMMLLTLRSRASRLPRLAILIVCAALVMGSMSGVGVTGFCRAFCCSVELAAGSVDSLGHDVESATDDCCKKGCNPDPHRETSHDTTGIPVQRTCPDQACCAVELPIGLLTAFEISLKVPAAEGSSCGRVPSEFMAAILSERVAPVRAPLDVSDSSPPIQLLYCTFLI